MKHVRNTLLGALALTLTTGAALAQAPVNVAFKDATMKLGLLAQSQYEAVGSTAKEGYTQGLFLRRIRLMVGGTIGDDFEYFFETDNPNLAKANADGTKNNGGLIIQDAFLTYKITKNIKVDMGLILVPGSHHGTQGATTLLTTDYSPYAFLQSGPLGNTNGRDGGVVLRGLLGGLEFRVGAFQGKRVATTTDRVAGNNALRFAARAQYNFFDAENGLFLGGTYLGSKKILSIGVAHDRQDDYQSTALDFFLDMPVGNNTITAQVNEVSWDGGTWITALPKQNTLMAEAGFRFGSLKLSPIVRLDARRPSKVTSTLLEETRLGAGLAYWFKGHNSNLKAFYQRVETKGPASSATPSNPNPSHVTKSYNQFNVQWQGFFF